MKKLNSNKGITLIALIITIIVLLILAGIVLAMVVGDNGILTKAQTAKERTNQSQSDEEEQLADYESYIDTLGRAGASANYSTEEKVVGKWIDGKPIYQRTFDNLSISLSWHNQNFAYAESVPKLIENVDKFIYCWGIPNPATGGTPLEIYKTNNSNYWGIKGIGGQTINILTIQYTKTTD